MWYTSKVIFGIFNLTYFGTCSFKGLHLSIFSPDVYGLKKKNQRCVPKDDCLELFHLLELSKNKNIDIRAKIVSVYLNPLFSIASNLIFHKKKRTP